jgi:hypothetical protein
MRGLGRLAGCPGSQRLTLKVLSQCDGEIAGDPGCRRPYAGAASVATRRGLAVCAAKPRTRRFIHLSLARAATTHSLLSLPSPTWQLCLSSTCTASLHFLVLKPGGAGEGSTVTVLTARALISALAALHRLCQEVLLVDWQALRATNKNLKF